MERGLPEDEKSTVAGDKADELRHEIRARLGELREAAFIAKPTDIAEALALLGDRHAVLYHCLREPAGWSIHAVLIAPQQEIRVHVGRLEEAADEAGEDAAWTTGVGALDALDAGDPVAIGLLLASPIDEQPWADLTEAILPRAWWDVLCRDDQEPIDLLVVPDGPIAGLPLAALPVRMGKPLLCYATVAMTPALTLLNPLAGPAGQHRAHQRTAVVHLDDNHSLPDVSYEAERWQAAARHMTIIDTTSQAELEAALTGDHSLDVVAISVHGQTAERRPGAARSGDSRVHLRGGSTMSTDSALRLPWPPTVILGACWISGVRTRAGAEPYGFPVACLLRGATTVLGGIAPIPDLETARILGGLIEGLPRGQDILHALRTAQAAEVDQTPPADIYPAHVAGLVAWTVTPAGQPAAPRRIKLHWNAAGLAPEEPEFPVGNYAPDAPLGDLMARSLRHSHNLARGRPAGTLDFVAAAMDTESADWTGFMVACELGPPNLAAHADDPESGTVLVAVDGDEVEVTTALGKAVRLGQLAADYLGDEILLPRHVVFAGLCDGSSGASQWLARYRNAASRDWLNHLSDRIFRIKLPEPDVIRGLDKPSRLAVEHGARIAGANLEEKDLHAITRKLNWWTPLAVGALIAALPAIQGSSAPGLTATQSHSALGVVFGAVSSRGTEIATVLPGSPASRAGLKTGDLVTAVDGEPITSLSAAKDVLDNRQPGSPISITIIRGTRRLVIDAVLARPIVFKNAGYIGVTVRSAPVNGVLVVSVTPGGPAAIAGLRAGDIITAVSGQPDGGSSAGTVLLIRGFHPGQTVKLSIIRDHRPMIINAIAAQQPSQ